ncbi:MAG: hypothetical protein RL685_5420 [Pseudomonadota bacterium]|jgi:prepilin-type N-terminal cleavage/methylation domain-containing protein
MRATKSSVFDSRLKRADSGFTLIELMIVVAIIGVLSGLAVFGVRKYLLEAKRAEAVSMLTQIRGAEEAYRAESFVYLGLEDFDTWHPTDDPGGKKYGWGFADNEMSKVFNQLTVVSNGPVEYSYAVVAGPVGGAIPLIPMALSAPFPAPTDAFYIAMAKADLNNDGKYTYAICNSSGNAVAVDDNY